MIGVVVLASTFALILWHRETPEILLHIGAVGLMGLLIARHRYGKRRPQPMDVEAVPLPALLLNRDGSILDLNEQAERCISKRKQDLLGQSVQSCFSPEDVCPEPLISTDTQLTLADPDHTTVRMVVTPTPAGRLLAILFQFDEPAPPNSLAKLERLSALGQMTAGISHNLNNMFTGIIAPAQLIQLITTEPKVKEHAALILSSSQRARGLVRRLYQAVRGQVDEHHPVDVLEIIEDAIAAARPRWKDEPQAQGNAITIHRNLSSVHMIKGTRTGLFDVLINLLFNAIDAMPDGGDIHLSTQQAPTHVLLEIRDNGQGMDPETIKRAFEPFFTTKIQTGTGLGLSTSLATLKEWGGDLTVHSAPDGGATFTLHLPLWQGSLPPVHSTTPATSSTRGQVLVVDDDESVRAALHHILADHHDVRLAASSEEALKGFVPGRYDVVVVDLGMPQMPGDQLATEIRKRDPAVATILITGWTLESSDVRAASFDQILSKPLDDINLICSVIGDGIKLRNHRASDV